MATSTQLADWRTCPRCRAPLEHGERSVPCPSCGLEEYANPAPTASALVRDDAGRILLARRAGEPGAGLWDLLGGFLDEGEEPLETLRRELREETGLELEPGAFLGGLPDRYGEDGPWTVNFYWEARLGEGEPSRRTTWPSSRGSPPTRCRRGRSSPSPTPSSSSNRSGRPSPRGHLACPDRCSRSPRSLSWGLGDFLAGLRTRRLPVLTVLVVSQAAGLTSIALVVAVRGVGPPDARYLGYAALAGAAGAVGLAALYRDSPSGR